MEDDFSVEVAVGELREEVKRLAAEVAVLNGRIEAMQASIGAILAKLEGTS